MKRKILSTIIILGACQVTQIIWSSYESALRGKTNALQANNSTTDLILSNLIINHNISLYIWAFCFLIVAAIWWGKKD